jgi:hypothetical protein
VTGSVNPEQAQKALRNLIEEMFPEVASDRDKAVEQALTIMKEEQKKTYSIAPVGHGIKKGAFGRIKKIIKEKNST